jgi:4-amino-4-deoxy-L-arabinose transferase-like glycosyltransferase
MRLRTLLPLVAILALHYALLYPYLRQAGQEFDAIMTYLPMARRLLADGLAYFANEQSIQMPPFAYTWPALFGAELGTVKLVNFIVSGATLLCVFRTARLLHSEAAGLAAAALFVACPTTRQFLATALSEGPYFFLTAVWIWSLAEYLTGGRRAYLAVAAVALGLATLTRGSLFYLLPVLVVLFAWKRERAATVAHLVALALPVAFIVKNMALFSFPFFATGSGNALYLGLHPVTGGYDPLYFGLLFDTGSVTQNPSPLLLESERLMSGIARMMILDTPLPQLAAIYGQKLGAFVFVSNVASDGDLSMRLWRIASLVLAAVGFAAVGSTLLRWVLATTLAYLVAVHVPVLYEHRYSVGALDLWLALLAGVGVAELFQRRDRTQLGWVALATAAGFAVGLWAWFGPEARIDVLRARNALVWEVRNVRGYGRMEIPVPQAPLFHPWSNFALVMDMASACDTVRLSYKRDAEAAFSPVVVHRVQGDSKVRRYQFGATTPLGLHAAGRLRIEAPCAMEIPRLAVYTPQAGTEMREKYLGRKD